MAFVGLTRARFRVCRTRGAAGMRRSSGKLSSGVHQNGRGADKPEPPRHEPCRQTRPVQIETRFLDHRGAGRRRWRQCRRFDLRGAETLGQPPALRFSTGAGRRHAQLGRAERPELRHCRQTHGGACRKPPYCLFGIRRRYSGKTIWRGQGHYLGQGHLASAGRPGTGLSGRQPEIRIARAQAAGEMGPDSNQEQGRQQTGSLAAHQGKRRLCQTGCGIQRGRRVSEQRGPTRRTGVGCPKEQSRIDQAGSERFTEGFTTRHVGAGTRHAGRRHAA